MRRAPTRATRGVPQDSLDKKIDMAVPAALSAASSSTSERREQWIETVDCGSKESYWELVSVSTTGTGLRTVTDDEPLDSSTDVDDGKLVRHFESVGAMLESHA